MNRDYCKHKTVNSWCEECAQPLREELTALRARVLELEDKEKVLLKALLDTSIALRAQVERYEEALKFYADKKKWSEFVLEYGAMFGSRDGDMCMAFDSEDDSPWAVARGALKGGCE